MQYIKTYFPNLTPTQESQFEALGELYTDWNSKINVISRKDIDNLYLHHILHSLGIAKAIEFTDGTTILDVGTGGGFPGIPLAILFPECRFHLIDRVGKKIKVAQSVAEAINLENVTFQHGSVEENKNEYDFVVSRAVMPLPDLLKLVRKNIRKEQHNALPNGLLCLKGGDLQSEIAPVKKTSIVFNLSDYFKEEYFETKKVIYVQIVKR
ncbi:16S rRNA (guanine(527)-N(7))-methyltransferase RsmG [Barnesiella sp. An55]|uniref:16S rRNA (guanine(527)-N(7))-methyltransferase RsmG n=1 Tax=Barnesiella sp. An55 TaxID=1965646 RepID=UPI000B36A78A|nr:16S rRNA (guanine(527)-N(7))-methyltransferase RsmG [Barnesiella sp. An55]OUN74754.1 16S rRNA (guanine(527)-N(7))-methyltransferase RsmG [Barnesiella sp. An55]HIZ27150.1 16S rRNA (guanine(527)-N(7))-methyltransferase RsmG [Candidatus Barnesiella merdipullorum]